MPFIKKSQKTQGLLLLFTSTIALGLFYFFITQREHPITLGLQSSSLTPETPTIPEAPITTDVDPNAPTKSRPRPTTAERLLLRSSNGQSLPIELKVILECIDNSMIVSSALRMKDSKDLALDSVPPNLRSLTILHPEYELHSTLELDPGKINGFAGLVTCYPAPKVEISGLSELAIENQPSLARTIYIDTPRPKNWPAEPRKQREKRLGLISESKTWPEIDWSPRAPDILSIKKKIQPNTNLGHIMISVPTSGSGRLSILDKSGNDILETQTLELHSGETTYLDLRRLNLASLTATYELPRTWSGDIHFELYQKTDSGLWNKMRGFTCEATGKLSYVGLRPLETRIILNYSVMPNFDLLPTERELTLKPGMNHVENLFGSPREFTVFAQTGKTTLGHDAGLEYEISRDGRVLHRDGAYVTNGRRRLCAWPSDTVRLIYKTVLSGLSSRDFIADECVLAPNQTEVSFEARQGAAHQLSGLNVQYFHDILILRGNDLLKRINITPRIGESEESEVLTLALPQGPLRLVFLRADLLMSGDSSEFEVHLSAPPLKPGELLPLRVEPRPLAKRLFRFVGNCTAYEFCLVDQFGGIHFDSNCASYKDHIYAFPKGLALSLISRRTGLRQQVEWQDLPEGEVQTIELP